MSGFTGRGVGVGDDRGKCTPRLRSPLSVCASIFAFLPWSPSSLLWASQSPPPWVLSSPSPFRVFVFPPVCSPSPLPDHWYTLGFTLFYRTPSLRVPDCRPRFSRTYVSMYPSCPFSFLRSYVTSFPPVCLPRSLLVSSCNNPTPQLIPKTLHSFPQIKKTLSFWVLFCFSFG